LGWLAGPLLEALFVNHHFSPPMRYGAAVFAFAALRVKTWACSDCRWDKFYRFAAAFRS
jgi:hypothetical protein